MGAAVLSTARWWPPPFFGGLLLWLCLGCETRSPLPEEIAVSAYLERAKAVASAAAARTGVIPLGAAPAIVESAFQPGRPTGHCTPVPSDSCSLDLIDEEAPTKDIRVDRVMPVRLVGWAAHDNRVPPVVVLELIGANTYSVPAVRLTRRPDVAKALGRRNLVRAGFDAYASFREVAAGDYGLRVMQWTRAGSVVSCKIPYRVTVE